MKKDVLALEWCSRSGPVLSTDLVLPDTHSCAPFSTLLCSSEEVSVKHH